jgi:hypothetical protein
MKVGFEVLSVVSTKMAVFWVVAPCSLVEVYQRFRGPCCLHRQGDEAARTSGPLVNFYQTTRRDNPEDSPLHENETSGSVKNEKCLDSLGNYQVLKDSVS